MPGDELQNGPAPVEKKLLRKGLLKLGVEEGRLPKQLKDSVVQRSKKGPVGAIVVREFTGVVSNSAAKVVRRFEQNISGGRGDIVEKLEAVKPELSKEQLLLLELLKSSGKKGLARLMAEAGVEPTSIMNIYARGCVALGRLEAAIEAHRDLPRLIKDLYRHALDGEGVCGVCVGTGTVRKRINSKRENATCPGCRGSGVSLVSSKLKEFAAQKILEATKIIEKSPLVQVQQQNLQVSGGNGSGRFFEKMLEVSDAILYPSRERAETVEAEVVQPKAD